MNISDSLKYSTKQPLAHSLRCPLECSVLTVPVRDLGIARWALGSAVFERREVHYICSRLSWHNGRAGTMRRQHSLLLRDSPNSLCHSTISCGRIGTSVGCLAHPRNCAQPRVLILVVGPITVLKIPSLHDKFSRYYHHWIRGFA